MTPGALRAPFCPQTKKRTSSKLGFSFSVCALPAIAGVILLVGVARFELATSCSQSRRANRATLHPVWPLFIGFRRGRVWHFYRLACSNCRTWPCGERGIRTPGTRKRYGSLANCWFQPLTHLSETFARNKERCFAGAKIIKYSFPAKLSYVIIALF